MCATHKNKDTIFKYTSSYTHNRDENKFLYLDHLILILYVPNYEKKLKTRFS